jgi:acetate kinase
LAILAVNGGSSSLKCALFAGAERFEPVLEFQVSDLFGSPRLRESEPAGRAPREVDAGLSDLAAGDRYARAMRLVLNRIAAREDLPALRAIGHRVVHGGTLFKGPTAIDAEVVGRLQSLVSLAPLHQPASIALIEACMQHLPDLPQCACFDTTFHRTQTLLERNYALPRELTKSGIHRYGFHGLSFEYLVQRLLQADEAYAQRSLILAHLGAGASLCAVQAGKSVATTMGFSALDGLPMGSRCGSMDPGVLIYLMRERQMDADELEDLLYRRSGWLGVSGNSSDMMELRRSDDRRSRDAIDHFSYRIVREIGSLAAAMGGLDCLVFSGGIGEHDAALRRSVADGCAWLGLQLDDGANRGNERVISKQQSLVEARVEPTSEAAMIARHTEATFPGALHG